VIPFRVITTARTSCAWPSSRGVDQDALLDPLKFLIVTSKLLTGFDAPILQTMYLDKPMRDHGLLQAICRTNRLYPGKTHGLIVDYLGAFDVVSSALDFDEGPVKKVITNLEALKLSTAGRPPTPVSGPSSRSFARSSTSGTRYRTRTSSTGRSATSASTTERLVGLGLEPFMRTATVPGARARRSGRPSSLLRGESCRRRSQRGWWIGG
jgi:hypothetical protein